MNIFPTEGFDSTSMMTGNYRKDKPSVKKLIIGKYYGFFRTENTEHQVLFSSNMAISAGTAEQIPVLKLIKRGEAYEKS